MAFKMKYSQLKWFSMELLIISFFSFDNFQGSICRVYDLAVVLWLFSFFYEMCVLRTGLKKLTYTKMMVVFLITCASSLIVATDAYVDNSLGMFERVLKTVLLTITIISTINDETELVHIWRPAFTGGIIAVLYQFANVSFAGLGSTALQSAVMRVSLSEKIFVNTYAYQMVISFIGGYFLLLWYKNNAITPIRANIVRLLILVGMVALLIGMFLTGSRKVLFAVVIFLFISICYGKKNFWKSVLIIVLVLYSYQALLSVPAFYNTVGWRIENMVEDKADKSADERNQLIDDAISTGNNHLFGVGLDNSKYYSSTREVYAHNNYFEFYADFGLLGMLAYYSFYVAFLFKIMLYHPTEKEKQQEQNFYLAIIMMMIFTEWFQIVYYNFGYHLILSSVAMYYYCVKNFNGGAYENRNNNSLQ